MPSPTRVVRRSAAGAFWRTGLAGAVLAVGWLVVSSGSGTPRAGADASAFVLGTADATSQAIALAPTTASLGYTVTLGQSIADYEANEGQAQSQTFNPGSIGVSLTSTQCNGDPPYVQPGSLPPPAKAESTNSNESQSLSLTQGFDTTGAGEGEEQASATTTPSAVAVTKVSDFSVPGSFEITGGSSRADSEVDGGQTRKALSSADVGSVSLLGGLVVLDGLHWEALQETGASSASSGSFSLAALSVAGQSVPVSGSQLQSALGVANTALGPTGFHVTLPQTTTLSDGSVQESPLSIGIDDSALGQQVIGPELGTLEPLRDAIDQAVLGVSCSFGTALLLGDIAVGVLSGGGNLDLELGGATAVTNGTAYADPFGSFGLGGDVGALGASDVSTGSAGDLGSTDLGTAGFGGSGAQAGSAAAETGNGSGVSPRSVGLRVLGRSVTCRSTAGGGCRADDALPVGLGSLGALGVVGATDVVRLRRRRHFVGGST